MKDKYTHGKKMARKGRTKVIYKGTFVSKQSLFPTSKKDKTKQNMFMLLSRHLDCIGTVRSSKISLFKDK